MFSIDGPLTSAMHNSYFENLKDNSNVKESKEYTFQNPGGRVKLLTEPNSPNKNQKVKFEEKEIS
jgi:hypothetical protein